MFAHITHVCMHGMLTTRANNTGVVTCLRKQAFWHSSMELNPLPDSNRPVLHKSSVCSLPTFFQLVACHRKVAVPMLHCDVGPVFVEPTCHASAVQIQSNHPAMTPNGVNKVLIALLRIVTYIENKYVIHPSQHSTSSYLVRFFCLRNPV